MQSRANELTQYFTRLNIDTIVIACHTSSTTALTYLQKTFPRITFIDMLSPTITAALHATKTDHIGIIATERSIKSHMHAQLLRQQSSTIQITEKACPLLVPLLEHNADKQTLKKALVSYIAPLKKTTLDTLILGCTHYAFLADIITQELPHVHLISAASVLSHTIEKPHTAPTVTCITTGELDRFNELLQIYCTIPSYSTKKELL